MNWDDLRLFLTTAEEGSFRQAALKLNLGHTTLSRRIETLEKNLGTKLFNRQSRGLELTPAGDEMLRTAKPVGQQFNELQVRMFGQDQVPRGNINLTVPCLFIDYLLLDAINEFCQRWPEITVNINSSLEVMDLSTKEADIAIRMTSSPGEQLIGRKVGVFCEAAYASPEYLEAYISDKKPFHRWISPGDNYKFVVELNDPYKTVQPHHIQLVVAEPHTQMFCAEKNMGLAMLPCVMADINPNLRRISNYVHRSDVWLLAHKDSRANKRMQLFREFLTEVFAENEQKMQGSN